MIKLLRAPTCNCSFMVAVTLFYYSRCEFHSIVKWILYWPFKLVVSGE